MLKLHLRSFLGPLVNYSRMVPAKAMSSTPPPPPPPQSLCCRTVFSRTDILIITVIVQSHSKKRSLIYAWRRNFVRQNNMECEPINKIVHSRRPVYVECTILNVFVKTEGVVRKFFWGLRFFYVSLSFCNNKKSNFTLLLCPAA